MTYVFRRCTRSRWRSRAFARQCYHCPSTARSCGAGIFFCSIPARRSTFPRDAPPAILGTDIDLGYLGHIFVVAERFFQLNADEAGEPSSVAVRNDDNLAPVCKKRGANAFFRSLALAVELALRRSSSPASPTDANLIILLSLPRVLCPHYSIFFLKCKCSEEVKGC